MMLLVVTSNQTQQIHFIECDLESLTSSSLSCTTPKLRCLPDAIFLPKKVYISSLDDSMKLFI